MSTDWRTDPEWRAFASDTGLPLPTRGEKLAVEAYKRTVKTRIEALDAVRVEGSLMVSGDEVLAVLEES